MPKSCNECKKYPMCGQYQEIRKSMDNWAVIDNQYFVFISLASHCKYYDEVIVED